MLFKWSLDILFPAKVYMLGNKGLHLPLGNTSQAVEYGPVQYINLSYIDMKHPFLYNSHVPRASLDQLTNVMISKRPVLSLMIKHDALTSLIQVFFVKK